MPVRWFYEAALVFTVRRSWAADFPAAYPDLTDEVTVLALAAVARRRLDACEAAHGVTSARREILADALRDWAFGAFTLPMLAERAVVVLEATL